MKICVLTSSYPQFKHDNAGIFVYNLVKKNALRKDIHQYVIAPHSKGSKFSEENQTHKIFRFPYFFPLSLQKLCYGSGIAKNIKQNKLLILLVPFFIIAEFIFLLMISKKESFDLIHAHWILPQGVIAYFCKKILKIHYIVSIHGSDILTFNNLFFRKVYEIVLSNADFVTANSSKTAESADRIIKTNIELIPMGVDLDLFYKDKTNKKNKNPKIIFVGRLIDWKGVGYLLDAIAKVKIKYPTILLEIIGDGSEKVNLQKRVKELKIENNVVFWGSIPNHKLPYFYRSSDIFVIPSIINDNGETEGLGTVTLEAMACGIPVIGTDVGGIPDIIKNKVTGFLVEEKNGEAIADCIIKILGNKSLRDDMCQNAQKIIVERFSWDVVSDRFIELYQRN